MKTYRLHPLAAAIFLVALSMGVMGLFVVVPVICIQWTWNSVIASLSPLPDIGIWQAGLLYLAFAAVFYLTGLIRIDVEAREPD